MHSDDMTTHPATQSKFWKVLGGILLVLIAVAWLGPGNAFGPNTPSPRTSPPSDIMALDDWLKASESATPHLREGTHKGIVWARSDRQVTPWAVVYIHGFSATRLETAPLADEVAKALGANLFYTRLTGHGQDAESMGKATAQDWLADTQEAIRIGRTLGQKVLVISCSTGSTLSTWFATGPDASQVEAMVFISPNFGLKNKLSEIINIPWGRQIATLVSGDTIQYNNTDPREAQAWTQSYPTASLFPMMSLVKKVRDSDLSAFKTPVFILYSAADQTVDPEIIKEVYARIGSPNKAIDAVTYSQSKGQHVLAGDIRDPSATQPMARSILQWLTALKPT